MKPVVGFWLSPPTADYSLARHLVANYAAAFERLGYDCIYAPVGQSTLSGQRALMRSNARLLFSHGGWLMSRSRRRIFGRNIRQELDRAGKPVLTLIADEPFLDWLPQIFSHLPQRAAVFFIDPSFAYGIEHWIPSGCHAPYLPCAHLLDGHGPVATNDKTIDLLFVGALGDPEASRARAHADAGVRPLFDALIERAVDDHATPLAVLAGQIRPGPFGVGDLDDPAVRRALQYAYGFIRAYRRSQLLARLVRHPVTIVTNRMPQLPGMHPGLVTLPPCPFPEMLRLLRQARTHIVLQPSFPGALNERIIFSMQARCLVITTPNPRTCQLFAHGEELLLAKPDYDDLDAQIETARDNNLSEPMRDRAQAIVETRFTPDANLRYMLGIMRERGLLDQDLPIPPGPMLQVPQVPAWRMQ